MSLGAQDKSWAPDLFEEAFDVAEYAHQELEKDKVGRRELYEKLGMELDDTVT